MERQLIASNIRKRNLSKKDFDLFAMGQFKGECEVYYNNKRLAIFSFSDDSDAKKFEDSLMSRLTEIVQPTKANGTDPTPESSANDILARIRTKSRSSDMYAGSYDEQEYLKNKILKSFIDPDTGSRY